MQTSEKKVTSATIGIPLRVSRTLRKGSAKVALWLVAAIAEDSLMGVVCINYIMLNLIALT